MSDHVDIETLLALLRHVDQGAPGPSLAEMRKDPQLAPLLRPDEEMLAIRSEFIKAVQARPKIECLAPVSPPCIKKPISSHSIQRAGPVSLLADKTNHVIMLSARVDFNSPPITQARRVGANKATTFPGLCSQHDTNLFREIDTAPLATPTSRQLFLLAYRALLRELYAKRQQERALLHMARAVLKDKGASPYAHAISIHSAYSAHVGAIAFQNLKNAYDKLWNLEAFDSTFRFIWRRTRPLSFAASSHFTPLYGFSGEKISRKSPDGPLPFMPSMSLDVIPDQTGTLISLAVPSIYRQELEPITSELERSLNDEQFLERIWELALRNCENIIIRPSAWESLPISQQAEVNRFFTSTTHSAWVPWPKLPMLLG